LTEISAELYKLNLNSLSETIILDAINVAHDIVDDSEKAWALREIAVELANCKKLSLAINIGFQICPTNVRHNCWKTISKNYLSIFGLRSTIELIHQFEDDELRMVFFNSISREVNFNHCDEKLIFEILFHMRRDIESMEILLHKHALYELFINDALTEKIKRFNDTLNIQWALEIKNQII
jgi:hypothetical protein